ncbi:hemolysin XhlA family protein [Clostridium arbusti]|uniref:hemolysin XhlA family protein n=1 Tax=Clostridium arbusti TaxID=1137848 RepID=UPI000288BA2F|nr:hemolysin XhlA family protein [Clostridium arbusti]
MENNDVIQEISERLVRIETKLDDFTSLKDKAEQAYTESKQNAKDITEIKDNIKWLWRTGLGAVIVIIVGAIIKFNWK